MIFDAEAYAEGICDCAAGSSIEVLVDTIDATVSALNTHAEDIEFPDEEDAIERDELRRLAERWQELRNEIVRRERENGEETVFPDNARYTVHTHPDGADWTIYDGDAPMEPVQIFLSHETAQEMADLLNATD